MNNDPSLDVAQHKHRATEFIRQVRVTYEAAKAGVKAKPELKLRVRLSVCVGAYVFDMVRVQALTEDLISVIGVNDDGEHFVTVSSIDQVSFAVIAEKLEAGESEKPEHKIGFADVPIADPPRFEL